MGFGGIGDRLADKTSKKIPVKSIPILFTIPGYLPGMDYSKQFEFSFIRKLMEYTS
jgi:hypothetical protein